jgi:hypothetical protein
MARRSDQDEMIERWQPIGDDLGRVARKRSAAKLGLALVLKLFAAHGQFPRGRSELPSAAVEFVAQQLRIPAVWAPQGSDGQKQARELGAHPDVENVTPAPSQG